MITINDMITECERELRSRKHFYSQYVRSGVMAKETARFRYDCMEGVLKLLNEVKESELKQMEQQVKSETND